MAIEMGHIMIFFFKQTHPQWLFVGKKSNPFYDSPHDFPSWSPLQGPPQPQQLGSLLWYPPLGFSNFPLDGCGNRKQDTVLDACFFWTIWTILRTLGSGTIQVVVGQLWSMATFYHFDTIFVHSDGLIQSNQSNQVGLLFTSNMKTLWSVYATLENGSPFDMHSIRD